MDTETDPDTLPTMPPTGRTMKTEDTARLGAELAERLRLARERVGLSQARLAEAAGLTKTQILNLEMGRGGGSRLDSIYSLSRVLGVPAGWLAFGG